MFKYDLNGPMRSIVAKSALRNELLTEWPNLSDIDIGTIETEMDLAEAVGLQTGRTKVEAARVVRNWMERQGLPPVARKAEQLRDLANENWENEGGPQPPSSQKVWPTSLDDLTAAEAADGNPVRLDSSTLCGGSGIVTPSGDGVDLHVTGDAVERAGWSTLNIGERLHYDRVTAATAGPSRTR
ncbi:hypothetical protein [Pelagibacterium sp. H642]|uniref:hypothetical protein n=1 Tax=Pelagibacterium sp. H642 TaxID=1881069 RepID=UPI0028157C29|nr:hypothetical protein [Pelagibacterium sp. H642]WMT92705.1 hypothetical protein NO934_20440 [Pelagibacterium sp. H642]